MFPDVWRVADLERSPKIQQQGCFPVADFPLCLEIQSPCWFKLRADAHQNSVALGCSLFWDARLVFYLVFSLFLSELCPVCCTRQRMLVLCSLQVGCSVSCSLPWNSAPRSLCVYRVSSIPSVALGRSRQNKYPSHTVFPGETQVCGCISPAGSSRELSEPAGHSATGAFGLSPSSNWGITHCCSMQMWGILGIPQHLPLLSIAWWGVWAENSLLQYFLPPKPPSLRLDSYKGREWAAFTLW